MRKFLALCLLIGVLATSPLTAAPLTMAFTYQGQIKQGGVPLEGSANFQFTLWDAAGSGNPPSGGTQIGGVQTFNGLQVTAGLFTVTLNGGNEFGAAAFDGSARWLQISVNGTALSSRQPLTAAPYSSTATNLRLPFSASAGSIGSLLSITNTSTGTAVSGTASGRAVTGNSTGPNGFGVYGTGNVGAVGDGTVTGVLGIALSDTGIGVHGQSNNLSGTTYGGHFESLSTDGIGVYGSAGINGTGVQGFGYNGVSGESTQTDGNGVVGKANVGTDGYGVWGNSTSGRGVFGQSNSGYGVVGQSNSRSGVYGTTDLGGFDKAGVYGYSLSSSGNGVIGEANGGPVAWGVNGKSSDGVGVEGRSSSGFGVEGVSTGHYGVRGVYSSSSGLDLGIFSKSGVWGDSGSGNGVIGSTAATGAAGVVGYATGNNYGVFGYNLAGTAVYGASNTWAGYFQGPLYATSAAASVKAFRIDHPLDPENKYLQHSSVESPDMKNIYDGVVTLGADGEAWVRLPNYFEALNRDFRYQLTAIGDAAPNLHIAQKVVANRFRIAGGMPGMEVSWQVTGIRQDPVANLYRIENEPAKATIERGRYLVPEAYGLSREQAINYLSNADASASTQPSEPNPR